MPARLGNRRNGWVVALMVLAVLVFRHFYPEPAEHLPLPDGVETGSAVQAAYAARQSGTWVETTGRVTRLLVDDDEGSRHQRFIVDVGNGHTVLLAHNIDLARRVPVAPGDAVVLRGRYEWNERGGIVHWTHHDPDGRDGGGWIRHAGSVYR